MIQQDFKQSMRFLAASVNIISTAHEGKKFAMTATSVTSLSMDPPSLLVCVNKNASIHDTLICDGQQFCVNLLSKGQEDIATTCSINEKEPERFQFDDWDTEDIPYLKSAQSNIFCKVIDHFEHATHTIFLGNVVKSTFKDQFNTLIYADGKYL